MNERINRVLAKMEEKGLTQLLVSDPLSIRFLTGGCCCAGGVYCNQREKLSGRKF